ncbi:MAG: ABC transporter ATP-binding protein/permease, partial [Rhodobacteraceae bacterium]|nr:ABC transporter ATP-binding protein/permease [Paracoccaceae bacterium]
ILDKSHRWERHLSENEQHCLGFARILLQRPDWVIIDDALTVVEPTMRHQIEAIFAERLAHTGVINIGHDSDPPGFYAKKLTLTATPLPA